MDEQTVDNFVKEYCFLKEMPLPKWVDNYAEVLPFAEPEKVVWTAYKLFSLKNGMIPIPRSEFHKAFISSTHKAGGNVSLINNFKMGHQTLLCFSGVRLKFKYFDLPGYRRSENPSFLSKLDSLEEFAGGFVVKHLISFPEGREKLSVVFNCYRYLSDTAKGDFLPDWELINVINLYIPSVSIAGNYPDKTLHGVKFSICGIDKPKMMQYILNSKKSKKLAFQPNNNA